MVQYAHLIRQPDWRLLHLEIVAASEGDLENLRKIHAVMAHRKAFRAIPEKQVSGIWNTEETR